MLLQIREAGLPEPGTQARVTPGRRWRWDFCWPEQRVLLDVQGGQFIKGGHQRPIRYENDCEKAAEAVLAGWVVLWATTRMAKDGRALDLIRRALKITQGDELT